MTEDTPKPSRRSPACRAGCCSILIGLVVTLIVGAVAEHVTDKEWLANAKTAQDQWVTAVQHTSPINVATMYGSELQAAVSGSITGGNLSGIGAPDGRGIQSPVFALVYTACASGMSAASPRWFSSASAHSLSRRSTSGAPRATRSSWAISGSR